MIPLLLLEADSICPLLWPWWGSEHFSLVITAETQVIPDTSPTFFVTVNSNKSKLGLVRYFC